MRAGCVEVDPPGVRFSFVSHMAGLYFHIPFCRRICAYCDFFKSAEVGRVDSVLDAMGRELDGAVDWLADRRIRTVYFGGGDRKSTRLNSSHMPKSRMPSSA